MHCVFYCKSFLLCFILSVCTSVTHIIIHSTYKPLQQSHRYCLHNIKKNDKDGRWFASTPYITYLSKSVRRHWFYHSHFISSHSNTTTHTHPFNGPFSRTTWVGRYQKGKTNLDFTEARDSEWQWHQLGHMQVCISLQTDNHDSTSPLSFLQARCPFCCPTNSVKALKAST